MVFFILQSGITRYCSEHLQVNLFYSSKTKQTSSPPEHFATQSVVLALCTASGCSSFRSAKGKLSYIRYQILENLGYFQVLQGSVIALIMLHKSLVFTFVYNG